MTSLHEWVDQLLIIKKQENLNLRQELGISVKIYIITGGVSGVAFLLQLDAPNEH